MLRLSNFPHHGLMSCPQGRNTLLQRRQFISIGFLDLLIRSLDLLELGS
jgi:hypothetical protein